MVLTLQAQIEQEKSLVQSNDTLMTDELRPVQLSADSLSVPLVSPIVQAGYYPFSMYGISPFSYQGFGTWELHKGFNASLGMSVTFSKIKHPTYANTPIMAESIIFPIINPLKISLDLRAVSIIRFPLFAGKNA